MESCFLAQNHRETAVVKVSHDLHKIKSNCQSSVLAAQWHCPWCPFPHFWNTFFGFQDSTFSWFSLCFTRHSLEHPPVADFCTLEQEVHSSLDSSWSIFSLLRVSYNLLLSMNTYKLMTLKFMFQFNFFPSCNLIDTPATSHEYRIINWHFQQQMWISSQICF